MSADADHEVIDSPEALFRHLYEEHGVEEALDLDPETAPLQFWLRRHAELERAQRAARRPPPDPLTGPEPEPAPRAEPRAQPPPRAQPEARSQPRPAPFQPEARSRPEPRPQPPPSPPGPGRRQAGFGDPLVEAVARALAGRGYNEGAVRSAIRAFDGAGSGLAGEAGVRAAFVEPMLQSVAEHLLGAGGSGRPATRPQPPAARSAAGTERAPAHPPAAPPPQPSRPAAGTSPAPPPATPREEPARPEAAWAVLWADLADPGRRPGAGSGPVDDDGDDLMAVANAVQTRRRARRRRR